jgi:hypothetical protein
VLVFLLFTGWICFVVKFDGSLQTKTNPGIATESIDMIKVNRDLVNQLRSAPWQGLRYMEKEKEWRFYAVAGETRHIELNYAFDVVKAYYLQADGEVSFTWAALGVTSPKSGHLSFITTPVKAGELVSVSLKGDFVTQSGVTWEDCKTEICDISRMVDSILVLDDQGTGISNGFIRFGWEPPTYPFYGFLCWQISPAGENAVVALSESNKQ